MFLLSRLIQPRGLKSPTNDANCWPVFVEAYTASWIEIPIWRKGSHCGKSRLIQPRGLKSASANPDADADSRGLYSLVDWNKYMFLITKSLCSRGLYSLVDWNHKWYTLRYWQLSRGLYSLVDWNRWNCTRPEFF